MEKKRKRKTNWTAHTKPYITVIKGEGVENWKMKIEEDITHSYIYMYYKMFRVL